MNEKVSTLLAEALSICGSAPAIASPGLASASLGGLDIALEYDEALRRIILWCGLRELPSSVGGEVYEFLLRSSLMGSGTGGGHIGLHAPTRTLLYSLELDEDGLDAPRLANAMQRFAEKASELIAEVEKLDLASRMDTPFMANVIWA